MAFAVEQIDGIHRLDDQLVFWPSSQVDRAIAVLAHGGVPMDSEQIAALIGGEVSIRSLRQRLYGDRRLQRVSKDYVGLSSWGGDAYTSIADLMIARLEQNGPMLIEDLVRDLHQAFEVSPSSVRMFSMAPVFLTRGRQVELRTAAHPYVPRDEPQRVTGLYRIGEDRLLLSLVVDRDLVRGSGRSVAHEVAVFLGVLPGSDLTLHSDINDVRLSWRERSNGGPQLGSVKPLLDEMDAQPGQRVHLVLDREYCTIEAQMQAEPEERESREQMLHRLTGIDRDTCFGLGGIARATWTSEFDVVGTLEERGDAEVAAAANLRS